jgi:menaquinone-dependent protoporphyrinogen oxidase
MNFFERAIIKRIAKTDKSISQIRENEIDRFVTEYQKTNNNRPEKGTT